VKEGSGLGEGPRAQKGGNSTTMSSKSMFGGHNHYHLASEVVLAMDREWGSKPGSGGAASAQNEAIDRRERLRRLALETIDLAKDPYFMRNHLGSYECKLCLTLHNNEGNYLAHTQGKRHQTNLAKRAAREAKDAPAQPQPHKRKVTLRKTGSSFLLFPLLPFPRSRN